MRITLLSGLVSVLLFVAASDAVMANSYVQLSIDPIANSYTNQSPYGASGHFENPPEGASFVLQGIPHNMTNRRAYLAPVRSYGQTGGSAFLSNLGVQNPVQAFVLANVHGGHAGVHVGTLIFTSSSGLKVEKELTVGQQLRDWLNGGFVNTTTDPDVTEVWSEVNRSDGLTARMDRLKVAFPSTWANETLQQIEIRTYANGWDDGCLWIEGGITIEAAEPVTLPLDILPSDCPNDFTVNLKSKGRLPMAILGSETVDVSAIDLNAISIGGVAFPVKAPSILDVSAPAGGEECACQIGTDGYADLVLHFSRRDAVQALGLDQMAPGTVVAVTVEGYLTDGTPFTATDCITLVGPE